MPTSAKIIADSINVRGDRITTFECTFWRPVLAEWNTHRMFSRNSASSRAIPLHKQIDRIMDGGPSGPVVWASEQKGMQGGAEIPEADRLAASVAWEDAAAKAIRSAQILGEMGVHKSIANRLLEPFMEHTVVVTATGWQNFFDQRCSPLAQPEIRAVAELMREEYVKSVPAPASSGDWHLPYIVEDDRMDVEEWMKQRDLDISRWTLNSTLAKVSAARCAQLSYLTQPVIGEDGKIVDPGGKRSVENDMGRYEKLMGANPKHWSPLEHVALPLPENRQEGVLHMPSTSGTRYNIVRLNTRPKHGNLLGWISLRGIVEAEVGEDTYR